MRVQTRSEFGQRMEKSKSKAELEEMLSKFGWKWAVMASTIGRIYKNGDKIPNDLLQQLRMTRNKIESGCYSICETACDLREIETKLFPSLTKLGIDETDRFLELTSKALNGTITENEINLSGIQPILSDCVSLPCVCQK
ncbi:MAG: hypothetical protein ACFFAJ_00260 [Candidatus Hodarchaeota archaeon]